MQNIFNKLGYSWHYQVLNSKNYGVPQNRERLFIVGFRDEKFGENFSFPNTIDLESTMADYLESNVSEKYYLGTKGINFVIDQKI